MTTPLGQLLRDKIAQANQTTLPESVTVDTRTVIKYDDADGIEGFFVNDHWVPKYIATAVRVLLKSDQLVAACQLLRGCSLGMSLGEAKAFCDAMKDAITKQDRHYRLAEGTFLSVLRGE